MRNVFFALGTILVLSFAFTILPVDKINWGRVSILPAATITVTGSSQGNVANQIASFNATVISTDQTKQTAIDKVNKEMTVLIQSVKDFGIEDVDIKTESVNVYQLPIDVPVPQTMMYPIPPQRTGGGSSAQAGDWQASNSITVTLRDVSKASALTDLLNKSGTTNVYGPNLTTDSNTAAADADLLSKAVANAKSKAESIAKSGGQTLGKMINVQETGANYPMMYAAKDLSVSSAPIEPGTSTLFKSVTVTYELK